MRCLREVGNPGVAGNHRVHRGQLWHAPDNEPITRDALKHRSNLLGNAHAGRTRKKAGLLYGCLPLN